MSFQVEIEGDATENLKKIIVLITKFCEEKLDAEYFQLSMKAIQYIIDDYDVLNKGKPENWASAIIYAIGSINFLFDKSFEPYVKLTDITDYFGTKKSTITNKGREIKNALDLDSYDPEFSTSHIFKDNPFNKLKMVNGFIVPVEDYFEDSDNDNESNGKSTPEEPKEIEKKDMNFGLFEGMDC